MTKMVYQVPAMRVVQLLHHGMLLTSGAKLSGYSESIDDAWDGNGSSVGSTIGNVWTDSGADAWD